MPKLYSFQLSSLGDMPSDSEQSVDWFERGGWACAMLCAATLLKLEDEEDWRLVAALFVLMLIYSWQRRRFSGFPAYGKNQVGHFRQAIKKIDFLGEEYERLNRQYPDVKNNFLKIDEDYPDTQEKFFVRFGSIDGYCFGYSMEFINNTGYRYKDSGDLLNRIRLDNAIKKQITHEYSVYLNNMNYQEERELHICFSGCECIRSLKTIDKMKKDILREASPIAVNKFRAVHSKPFTAKNIYSFFRDHLESKGFSDVDNLDLRIGNPPDVIAQKYISENDDRMKLTCNEQKDETNLEARTFLVDTTKINFAKMFSISNKEHIARQEWIQNNTAEVDLEENALSGLIQIGYSGQGPGHAMAYSFGKRSLMLFDCNSGLYDFPDAKRFCSGLAGYLHDHYPDAEEIKLTSMIIPKKMS